MYYFLSDAFLNQIHRGTAQLESLVGQINNIIEAQVESTINKIQDMIFFDYKRAFSQSWVSKDPFTLSNCVCDCNDANKWAPLSTMMLFILSNGKHQR